MRLPGGREWPADVIKMLLDSGQPTAQAAHAFLDALERRGFRLCEVSAPRDPSKSSSAGTRLRDRAPSFRPAGRGAYEPPVPSWEITGCCTATPFPAEKRGVRMPTLLGRPGCARSCGSTKSERAAVEGQPVPQRRHPLRLEKTAPERARRQALRRVRTACAPVCGVFRTRGERSTAASWRARWTRPSSSRGNLGRGGRVGRAS